MEKGLNKLLLSLEEEIELKCFTLKKKRQERFLKRWFVFFSMLFVTVPVLLVYFGIPFAAYVVPALILLAVGALLLSPVVFIKGKGAISQ